MFRPVVVVHALALAALLVMPGCNCRVAIGPKAATKTVTVKLPGRTLKITATQKVSVKAGRDAVTITLAPGKVVVTKDAIEVDGARKVPLDPAQRELELNFAPGKFTVACQGRALLEHRW